MPYNRRAKGAVSRGMLEPYAIPWYGAYVGADPHSPLGTQQFKENIKHLVRPARKVVDDGL